MITLPDAITEFLIARAAEGLSPRTLTWYAGKLKQFAGHIGSGQLDSLTTNELRCYLVALRERGTLYPGRSIERAGALSAHTIAGHDRLLRLFFSWCSAEYGLSINPMDRIRKPKVPAPLPKAMQFDDLLKLLATCDDSTAGRRDRALILFLADTGCRAGGVCGLTDQALRLDDRRAIVTEKGGQSRHVYFLPVTAAALAQWIDVRPGGDSIFTGLSDRQRGKPLAAGGLYRILKRRAAAADINGAANPHSLRHMFAMMNLSAGNDLHTVSRLLGHSDIKTTEHYLRFTDQDRADKHDAFSPLLKIL